MARLVEDVVQQRLDLVAARSFLRREPHSIPSPLKREGAPSIMYVDE